MKIAFLMCDEVDSKFRHIDGGYVQMFERLLPQVQFTVYQVYQNEFPDAVQDHELYLCNGSRRSVYENLPWIQRLKALVKAIHQHNKWYIGVCFGHQMLGAALGGTVKKADKGWCVGIHHFQMVKQENWMQPYQKELRVLMMCQDQIVGLPPDSEVLATSVDCEVAMFRVGHRMLGIQAHPEFSKAYTQVLMEKRIDRIGHQKVQKGIESLNQTLDNEIIANYFRCFLQNSRVENNQ